MAGAYAALVSLSNTITMEHTPRPSHLPIPLPRGLVDALQERVKFLVEFLEQGWKGDQHLLDRIVDLAYAAEDAIESPIVDQILSRSTTSCRQTGSPPLPNDHDLERIIHGLESIMEEVMKNNPDNNLLNPARREEINFERLEEEKIEIMEELMGHQSCRRVIPIVEMDGVGKIALAKNVFDDKCIKQHFSIRVRVRVLVSQEYNVKEILIEILCQLEQHFNDEMDEESLGEKVSKSLSSSRYLVMLDDLWVIDVWNRIQSFFPDNDNGSRIMVTTMFSNLARELVSNHSLGMECIDENNSWNLLCEKVFVQRSCPLELEAVGKKIACCCRGLPLAIDVVGGLLETSKTVEFWMEIAENLSTSIYLSDDEQCLKILALSYEHLPIHLKPCFLYMGVPPYDITASKVCKLWILEGLLKPIKGKTFEEISEENLKELMGRNLFTVSGWDLKGQIGYCEIHELLRKLCLKEAKKEKFLCVVTAESLGDPLSLKYHRRVLIRLDEESVAKHYPQIIDSFQSASYVRSLIVDDEGEFLRALLGSPAFKLLRVLYVRNGYTGLMDASKVYLGEVLPNLVNLRHLDFEAFGSRSNAFRIDHFRNLQMLVDMNNYFAGDVGCEIWKLPHLRHVKVGSFTLSEHPSRKPDQCNTVLENLQTLFSLSDFVFDEAILHRIPNVKRLKVTYCFGYEEDWSHNSHYRAQNLCCLQKLESFNCAFYSYAPSSNEFLQSLASTRSLKKLSLYGCQLPFEGMTMIGSLPNLETLILQLHSFSGSEWNPIEGEFLRLRSLQMKLITDLICWNADSTHFPCLEQLVLIAMGNETKLRIPLGLAEIATLELIQLEYCSVAMVMSAKAILEKQQSLGNHGLVVRVWCIWKIGLLQGFEDKNFLMETTYDEFGDNDAGFEDSDDQENEDEDEDEYEDANGSDEQELN